MIIPSYIYNINVCVCVCVLTETHFLLAFSIFDQFKLLREKFYFLMEWLQKDTVFSPIPFDLGWSHLRGNEWRNNK